MRTLVRCNVNGEDHAVVADTRDTLLDLLRLRLRLTGTKEGCGNGNCGACTVLLDGQPVCACLVLAQEVEGHAVTTIESLAAPGVLHPVQKAIIAHGGTQCGFCTPGIVLSAVALLNRVDVPDADDIRHAIAGNLCRCTGYDKIVAAISAVALDEEE